MDGWREISNAPTIRPPRDPQSMSPAAVCSAFDEQSDLIWVGDTSGALSSFAGAELAPYTRFIAHRYPVKRIISHPKGIISTDGHTLRLTNRRGLMVFDLDATTHRELSGIRNLALIGTNELLISSTHALVKFDVVKTQVLKTIPHQGSVKLMVSNKRYAALGNHDGSIDIYEVKSDSIIATFQMNCTTLSDLDLKEQTLVACGITERPQGSRYDSWVTVYDVKSLRLLSPVTFPEGAAYVRLHPKSSSVALIGSLKGLIHAVDMFSPDTSSLFSIDALMLKSLEISSTGDYVCMLDDASKLHLCSLDPEHSTMSNRVPIERPDPQEPHKHVFVDDMQFALSEIGMPFYKETLLSAWPPQIIFKSAGTISKGIDISLQRNAQSQNGLAWASYDREKYGCRNQVKPYVSVSRLADRPSKFLSARNTSTPTKGRSSPVEPDDVFQYKTNSTNTIPNAFKKLQILYSKFGIDDFDFDFYNKTNFSGLESHVDNSYTNSLLQLYRFVPEIFNFIIGNLAVENLENDSLLTELGYLYDMLIKADGKHYRPSNFQHTLSSMKEAADLGLLESDALSSTSGSGDIGTKLMLFNSFFLQKIARDENKENIGTNKVDAFPQIVGLRSETHEKWYYSKSARLETENFLNLNVTSPVLNRAEDVFRGHRIPSIVNYIDSSMNKISRVSDDHEGFKDIKETTFTVTSLPLVLSCNLDLTQEDMKNIRGTTDWFKSTFYCTHTGGGYLLTETSPRRDEGRYYEQYDVVGYVCEISGENDYDSHLVTFVKVDGDDGAKTWYLFNDFLVMPIPESEVFNMSHWWKTPLTVVYRKVSQHTPFQYDGWQKELNDSILYRDHFAAGTRQSRITEYRLLTKSEAPQPGSLIAIDAEFVTLEPEQFEIRNNGVRSLLKPKRSALARVSVLRGDDDEMFGIPFIDDYVVVKESIQDYVTSFSGISHGDLDPETSDKALVTRQTVYRKLWLLLNLGCVFVGHGLTMDFRTINICVPKEQVRDTAVFFHKGQRILSLRFLAYSLLNANVQQGNHDSIEDAHTALLIYKRYLELQQSGEFEQTLDQIFVEGQMLKFKPPGVE